MELAFIIEKFGLILVIFLVSLTIAAYSTLAERKIAGFLQDRVGPNRAGPGGMFQPLADGLKMFFDEPFFPDNGYDDKDWKNDFQLTLHIQDDLKPITKSGNIFLTNIHRVFFNEEPEQNFETTFLGVKPKPDADTSKGLDLGKVMRSDKIKDLVVLNDEAHHIHDSSLAWFKSIEDISNKLKLKNGNGISLQADYSATPKHNNGAIFVQTICDYPLVEAIKQNVVKSPVLPDEASRQKIQEKDSSYFEER
jgi:type III restriction enzyme